MSIPIDLPQPCGTMMVAWTCISRGALMSFCATHPIPQYGKGRTNHNVALHWLRGKEGHSCKTGESISYTKNGVLVLEFGGNSNVDKIRAIFGNLDHVETGLGDQARHHLVLCKNNEWRMDWELAGCVS
jgi:hypothetical protein